MGEDSPSLLTRSIVPFWGVFGVASILANGLRRVLPLALEPFRMGEPLTPVLLCSYVGFGAFMAYAEGYRGFYCKFSPNVVLRSLELRSTEAGVLKRVLAPLYCMELFGAPFFRVMSSWCWTISIMAFVIGVKRMPPKARSVIDAGVVTGLSLGITSLFYHYFRYVLVGKVPIREPAGDAEKRMSLCPVTLISTVMTRVVHTFVGVVFGRERLEQMKQQEMSKSFLMTCPISGKEGTSEQSCPISRFMQANTQDDKDK
eukprot:TRINITY_DN64897_c0_g1_i1.p1 TRINITY_DN64897_c0_g1~~TRINITY_DN64897_c0_g1_i1.p1  ORF type:complete len:271 (+),score=38.64 TRINITY_DN64897_c0_g1_i1:42-815(+)